MTFRAARRLWFVMASSLSVGACSKAPPPKGTENAASKAASNEAGHKDEPEHEEVPRQVRLSPEVLRNAHVSWTPTAREALVPTVTLPGEMVADPDRSGRIAAPVAGRLEQVTFREGLEVKKGDALAVLRVPDLGRLRGALAATSSKAAAARMNADRLKALVEQRLAAHQAFLDAEAEAHSLDAEAKALKEQLRAMGASTSTGNDYLLPLRAPVSGTVVHREAVVGQPVGAEQTLGTIADLTEAWFIGRVFEKDLGRLHVGAAAEVQLNAYPRERFEGVINGLGQQVDAVARTVTARIHLTNRDGMLRLGLFGSARIATDEPDAGAKVLVVPASALTDVLGKTVVFVHHEDDDFELHEVVTGNGSLGRVEIRSGLRDGEEVVTQGVFTLKSVVLKRTFAEGD